MVAKTETITVARGIAHFLLPFSEHMGGVGGDTSAKLNAVLSGCPKPFDRDVLAVISTIIFEVAWFVVGTAVLTELETRCAGNHCFSSELPRSMAEMVTARGCLKERAFC